MKLKTSLFNWALVKSNFKRFWPLFLAYFAVLILALPMVALSGQGAYSTLIIDTIGDYLSITSLIVCFITAVSAAACVYGFMYNQKTCGMIASLPLKRKSIFVSSAASGVIPVLIINLLVAIITVLPLLRQYDALALEALLIWLAVTSLHYLTFFGIASIIAVITGSNVAFAVFYLIFNFLAVGVETALREIFSDFIYGFSDTVSALSFEFLSPAVHLANRTQLVIDTASSHDLRTITDVSFSCWRLTLIYAAVGIALTLAAKFIFRGRRMENCGDIIAIPSLRPIFKYGVALCTAMANGILLRAIIGVTGVLSVDVGMYVAYLIIGAFIGYFGSEMLLRKRFDVFRGNWTGFFILAAVCVIFMWCCKTDYAGIGSRVPEGREVSYVELGYDYAQDTLILREESSIEDTIKLSRSIIENKAAHLAAKGEISIIRIDYYLESGRIISREYEIASDSEDFALFRSITSSAEAKEYLTTPAVEVAADNVEYGSLTYLSIATGEYTYLELSKEQTVDFFRNGYCADVYDGSIDFCTPRFDNYAYVEICFGHSYSEGFYGLSTYILCPINLNCEHSLKWVADNLGIDLTELLPDQWQNYNS